MEASSASISEPVSHLNSSCSDWATRAQMFRTTRLMRSAGAFEGPPCTAISKDDVYDVPWVTNTRAMDRSVIPRFSEPLLNSPLSGPSGSYVNRF